MALTKPTKPQWADGSPTYVIEPSAGKKSTGWLSQEKPPFQWMNWLFLKIKQWLDWTEERTEFQDSISLHTTGAALITWSAGVLTVPLGGMVIEWRERNAIITNVLPAAAYALADGEYLIFSPSSVDGTNLSPVAIGAMAEGKYAITTAAGLLNNTTCTEVILFRRRGSVLEVPMYKVTVQNGGSFSSNELITHTHADADDGGTLLWDNIFAVANAGDHDHSSTTEGGKLDWDTCWADAVHDHSSNAEGGSTLSSITSFTAANALDIGPWELRAETFQSDVVGTFSTGSAPFTVASQRKVSNLNADFLDNADTIAATNHSGSWYIDDPNAASVMLTDSDGWLYTPNAAPDANYKVANKKYVDDAIVETYTELDELYYEIYALGDGSNNSNLSLPAWAQTGNTISRWSDGLAIVGGGALKRFIYIAYTSRAPNCSATRPYWSTALGATGQDSKSRLTLDVTMKCSENGGGINIPVIVSSFNYSTAAQLLYSEYEVSHQSIGYALGVGYLVETNLENPQNDNEMSYRKFTFNFDYIIVSADRPNVANT